MLQMFLCALEDQLGIIVAPPLAPVARMSIIEKEIELQLRAAQLLRAADKDDTTEACPYYTHNYFKWMHSNFKYCPICGRLLS
jgi:hypothetical protein